MNARRQFRDAAVLHLKANPGLVAFTLAAGDVGFDQVGIELRGTSRVSRMMSVCIIMNRGSVFLLVLPELLGWKEMAAVDVPGVMTPS